MSTVSNNSATYPVDLSRVLVVLPALNEEHNIEKVVRSVRDHLPEVGLLVVDDGSTDDTGKRAAAAGARVARLVINLGVGGAMRTGFRYAERNGYTTVVQVDADGQHDPAEVIRLIARLDECDLVIGARFAGVGNYTVRGPRRWAMWALALTTSRLAKTRLTDATSGFRAAGPRAVKLFARSYPAEYLGDTVESLVMATRAGLVIGQVPVSMRVRAEGTPSQTPIRSAIYLLRAGLALLLALVRRRP